MGLWRFLVTRRKRALATVVVTPPALDLDPGEVGVVVVSGLDAQGRPVPIQVRDIAPVPGLTIVREGTQITVTAASEGPVEDEVLTVTIEVV